MKMQNTVAVVRHWVQILLLCKFAWIYTDMSGKVWKFVFTITCSECQLPSVSCDACDVAPFGWINSDKFDRLATPPLPNGPGVCECERFLIPVEGDLHLFPDFYRLLDPSSVFVTFCIVLLYDCLFDCDLILLILTFHGQNNDRPLGREGAWPTWGMCQIHQVGHAYGRTTEKVTHHSFRWWMKRKGKTKPSYITVCLEKNRNR